jgi:hypothetical protein
VKRGAGGAQQRALRLRGRGAAQPASAACSGAAVPPRSPSGSAGAAIRPWRGKGPISCIWQHQVSRRTRALGSAAGFEACSSLVVRR